MHIITMFSGIVLSFKIIGERCMMPYKIFSDVMFLMESKTLLFGLMPQEWLKRDKYLLNILLVAGKKALTRKWLSQEGPTLNTWMDITVDIYKMERITAYVNHKMELFVSRWDNWVNYVTPHRPDFIFYKSMIVLY